MRVVERIEVLEELGFDGVESVEIPVSAEDAIEESVFKLALGEELPIEGVLEGVEDGLFFEGDFEVLGSEAVGAGVLGGDGFAVGGAGSCGWRCHDAECWGGERGSRWKLLEGLKKIDVNGEEVGRGVGWGQRCRVRLSVQLE